MSTPTGAERTTLSLAETTTSMNAWVEVDLDALSHNIAAIRGVLGEETEIIAVVKANAYGHGAIPLARALQLDGVERFGVAWLSEALELRAAGVTMSIIVLEHVFPSDAEAAVANDITCTLHSTAHADAFSAAAVKLGSEIPVQVKVDTGLHRFGIDPEAAVALANYCRGLPGLRVEAIWTHLANSDEQDDSFSALQLERFAAVRQRLHWVPYAHVANSAGTLRRTSLHFDGVRAGIAIYGICPPNTPDPGLVPILSLRARLARVQHLAPGEGVSYGLTWVAERPSVVGLVPIGYGDGWRRTLGNTGSVLVAGRRCPMIGRVCMDQFLVDLTDLPLEPAEGDIVTLIGEQDGARIAADEVGELTDTIAWEVVAALLPRTPRIYVRGGAVQPLR